MALVGDVLMAGRAMIPDLPLNTLPTPANTAASVSATGSTLPAGNYAVVVTQRNPWGETLGTETTGINIAANQGIQITSALLPGAVAIRAYLTLANGAAGTEIQFQESTSSPFTISAPPTGVGVPPTRSTAYLPDVDGAAFGASTLYDWLNDGLRKLSRIAGGLLDYGGVATLAGNPLYVLPGTWLKITDVWFNGYWVQGGKRGDFFRRNAVPSQILTAVTVSIFTDRQVIETSYQSNRTAGTTTTTANMLATDTSVPIASSSVFTLPFGFAQIGTETVAYSNLASSTMAGLIRGVGSASDPVAWPSGTVVTELPLFWCGRRVYGRTHSPGDSAKTLHVPDGWDSILKVYLLARSREAEQDRAAAEALYKQFDAEGQAWMLAYKDTPSYVQVGGANVPMTYANTPAGGLILP